VNGHSTAEEIRARMTELDSANGWGNRFVYIATRRERRLPGHEISDERVRTLARPLADAIAWAREHEPRMIWAPDARERWNEWYCSINDDVTGLVGALTSRSEAHTLRFALNHAVADRTSSIKLEHLEAALAIWQYSEATVQWVWGDLLGNSTADEILRQLEAAGAQGLSRTAIRNNFSRHPRLSGLDVALALLEQRRLAFWRTVPTPGRPATWWWHHKYFSPDQAALKALKASKAPRSTPANP
jgi:hypothetical protein